MYEVCVQLHKPKQLLDRTSIANLERRLVISFVLDNVHIVPRGETSPGSTEQQLMGMKRGQAQGETCARTSNEVEALPHHRATSCFP